MIANRSMHDKVKILGSEIDLLDAPGVDMLPLDAVLADLPGDRRDRIVRALELMRRQSIGSERYRHRAVAIEKKDKSPVTVADLLHQMQLQQLIADNFPSDGLICEEPRSMQLQILEEAMEVSRVDYGLGLSKEVAELPEAGDIVWLFDPIDGTKGYLAGRYYAIALGLFVDGLPYFSAMAVPPSPTDHNMSIDGALAFAINGRGSWIGSIGSAESRDTPMEFQPIRRRTIEEGPVKVAISLEHGKFCERLDKLGEIELVKLDSQAKYLAVATGDIDLYVRERRDDGYPDVMWDHMPGGLIASESGCAIKHFTGDPVEFEPQRIVRFEGGVICHGGSADDRIGQAVSIFFE